MTEQLLYPDVESLVARVADGAKVAVFKDSGVPMAMARALVRRGVKDLHLVTVPTGGLLADLLIGAGCVAVIETSGVTMGELGQAPCFGRAVKSGDVVVRDATCPAVYAGLQAAEKGIPFMPLRGLIGSDIVAHRDDYRIIDNPFGHDDPIVALPAIQPDVALIHARLADRHGNVWIARQPELKLMAHAARETLVTVEELYDGNLMEDEQLAAAAIPSFYVTGFALAERGAWPLAMPGRYPDDVAHLEEYCRLGASAEGFQAYLAKHVTNARAAAE